MAGIPKVKITFDADFDELKRGVAGAQNEVQSFGDKMGKFGKMAGAAFAVASAAALAYAGVLLKQGVESAIADEQAQAKLATTLQNVTGATDAQIKAVEDQILKTSLLTGKTDDELRPSFERLVRATKDSDAALKLQSIALDVSAGSGKSLEAVTNAMAKAAEGNTASLAKLGVGLTSAQLKTMSMDEITKQLASTFANQASIQADTFAGKMARLKVAFDEGKETIGSFVLDAITPMIDTVVNVVIPAVAGFIDSIGGKEGLTSAFSGFVDGAKKIFIPIFEGIKFAFDQIKDAITGNKEEFAALFEFLSKYVAPLLGGVLKLAIEGIGIALGVVINVLGKAIGGFQKVADVVGNIVNAVKDLIQLVKNNPLVRGLGSLIDSAFGGFRAAGGSVSAGTPYVVGERGAELFVPSSSGTIVPNNAMGGSTINITVNGAIDAEGTARTIVDVLNRSNARGTLGANRFALV
jgi:formylmethanofuran dehydrogenase subunit C